jgi:hypothetical protein
MDPGTQIKKYRLRRVLMPIKHRRLSHLKLRDREEVEEGNTSAGAVSMLEKVSSKTLAFKFIGLIDSFVDGRGLVNVLQDAMQGTGGTRLKEITINSVKGITRDECDSIRALGVKLNVYV